jgi:hypothetical protein
MDDANSNGLMKDGFSTPLFSQASIGSKALDEPLGVFLQEKR